MKIFTTEITSDKIESDNPIHQRLLKPYYSCKDYIKGDLLELGCGEGRGIPVIRPLVKSYLGIDKISSVISELESRYEDCRFERMHFPPLSGIMENSFDSIISFQVIEHIKNDYEFLIDISRVLKPGGIAILTTPNRKMTLTRNPWHIREYSPEELSGLCRKVFREFTIKGITGNDKVMRYYDSNKRSVNKLTRFDFFNLQYRLPAVVLRWPYDILNRVNRKSLNRMDKGLVTNISYSDYEITDHPGDSLDLMCLLYKQ